MAFVKEKRPYIIFLTRTSLIVGGDSIKEPFVVEFATGVFFDLEFPNTRNLNNQLLTIVEQYNLKPERIIFVLSQELYFTQMFSSTDDEQVRSYLSIIPFNEIISKKVSQPQGQEVVAVSKDLVNPLVEVFTHHGFSVVAVIPELVMGDAIKGGEQFTQQTIDAVIAGLESFEPYSFFSLPKVQESMTSLRDSQGHIFNPRLIAMIVFFVVLIGILVGVLVMNGYVGSSPKPAPVTPPVVPVVIPSATPIDILENNASISATENAASESAIVDNIQRSIPIEVLASSANKAQADRVKSALSSIGFRNITTGDNQSVGLRTLILYRPTVTKSSLDAAVGVLKELGIDASAQESPDLDTVDVRILVK